MIDWWARIVSSLKTPSRLVDPSTRASQAMPLLLISKTASGAFSASTCNIAERLKVSDDRSKLICFGHQLCCWEFCLQVL